jgi:hypothetical protein
MIFLRAPKRIAAGRRTFVTIPLAMMLAASTDGMVRAQQTSVPTPTPSTEQPAMPVPTAPAAQQPAAPAPATAPEALPAYPKPVPAAQSEKGAIGGYNDPSEQPLPPTLQNSPMQQHPTPLPASSLPAMPPYDPDGALMKHLDHLGSTYIPVDSPVYPMALRLYSLGYIDSAFINMRPWTRRVLLHMLDKSAPKITEEGNDEAVALLARLKSDLADEGGENNTSRGKVYGVETVYTRMLGISGQSLRDSFHLGQTIANDYGRPYEPGFNNNTGFSSVNEWGRFSLYVRGEYQHAPSGTGYSTVDTGNPLAPGGLTETLSLVDQIPYPGTNNVHLHQATIPSGPIAAQNPFRLMEATLSFHLLGHEISGGKSDYWVGPGMGGGMAFSNNAEDIYSFRVNRVEPMHIPLFSKVFGDVRYDFFVGSLKGHTYPNSPWMHAETVTLAPTKNVQIAFERTAIWGGQGHEPITLHTFLHSFFNLGDTQGNPNVKYTTSDPGARFSVFSFSWRLPFLRHYVTLYTDSIAHDDVSPPSAPRRAAYRPGFYISQFPGLRKLDLRVEAASTDTSTLRSLGGQFNYYETIQRQGYTNKGFIMADTIGREAKGGNAWLTYHLGPDEWIQASYMDKKTPKDFIAGGTTQGQFKLDVLKTIHKDVQLDAWVQYERWKAPIYMVNAGNAPNHDTAIAAQVTWYPKLKRAVGIDGR